MASWLVHSSLDLTVQIQALARDIVLHSWGRHLSHSAFLHPGVQMGTSIFNARGHPVMDYPIQGGLKIFLVASCYRNQDISSSLMGHLACKLTYPKEGTMPQKGSSACIQACKQMSAILINKI